MKLYQAISSAVVIFTAIGCTACHETAFEIKGTVWEVPQATIAVGPDFPVVQDADWLFQFDPNGTVGIYMHTPAMTVETPVKPRWSYGNSTLVIDWTDQLSGPQENHRQLLAYDQTSVTWLRSSGGQERWTRAEIPSGTRKSSAQDDNASSKTTTASTDGTFPAGNWRFFHRGPSLAWHTFPEGGRVRMMQILAVNRYTYIHPDGTCRLIIDSRPDGGQRSVENLSGTWIFGSGTLTLIFPNTTIVRRDGGHDTTHAQWFDDSDGGREEDWTVIDSTLTGEDADQPAAQIPEHPAPQIASGIASSSPLANGGIPPAGPGPDGVIQPNLTRVSPDRGTVIEQYHRPAGDGSYLWQFWAREAGKKSIALNLENAAYPADFHFTQNSQWIVRVQKTGSGEGTVYLYHQTAEGFASATSSPLGDLAWDFLKSQPDYQKIEQPNFHFTTGVVRGLEDSYRSLHENWPDSRYVVLSLYGDALPSPQHHQLHSVRGWRCVYDLQTGTFSVPPELTDYNKAALAPDPAVSPMTSGTSPTLNFVSLQILFQISFALDGNGSLGRHPKT